MKEDLRTLLLDYQTSYSKLITGFFGLTGKFCSAMAASFKVAVAGPTSIGATIGSEGVSSSTTGATPGSTQLSRGCLARGWGQRVPRYRCRSLNDGRRKRRTWSGCYCGLARDNMNILLSLLRIFLNAFFRLANVTDRLGLRARPFARYGTQ